MQVVSASTDYRVRISNGDSQLPDGAGCRLHIAGTNQILRSTSCVRLYGTWGWKVLSLLLTAAAADKPATRCRIFLHLNPNIRGLPLQMTTVGEGEGAGEL